MQELILVRNRLSGNLTVLTSLFSLSRVRIDNNALSGTIPPFLSNQLSVGIIEKGIAALQDDLSWSFWLQLS